MTSEEFTKYLYSHGAREYEVVALQMDEKRALAAMQVALDRNAERPVPYALKLFDSPEWNVPREKPIVRTNLSVESKCTACDGDRFVPVTDDWRVLYGETYAPCRVCNEKANTEFWTVDGRRSRTAAR